LKNLRSQLEYIELSASDKIEESKIDQLSEKLQQIIQETNASWVQMRKETEGKGKS